jgi:hypothetical protein
MEAGQFDDLPGAGKPIPDLAEPHDELWWVRKWLARNDVPAADVRGLKRRRPPAR